MAKSIPKIKILLFLTFSLLLSVPQLLAAQRARSETLLTLEEAVKKGLVSNPKITAVRSQVDASAARVSQARSGFFPKIDLSESFNRTTNPMWAFGTKLNQEVISQPDFDPAKLNDPEAIDNLPRPSLSLCLFTTGGRSAAG